MEVRIIMEAFPVKTIEERGGSGAIKATVVKAQADSGHERTIQPFGKPVGVPPAAKL